MILDNNKNITVPNIFLVLYFLCVAALAAIVYQLARENVSLENVYEHVNLVSKTSKTRDAPEHPRYAMREDDGRFLFVAGSPVKPGNKLVFHRTADIRFRVNSLYQTPSCTATGKNKATLVVSSPPISVRKLLDTPEIEFTIKIIAGDTLKVRLDNPAEPQCGQATVSLYQINNTSPGLLLVSYLSVWLVIGLLLARSHLGYMALWGAVVHVLYVYSETLSQQSLGLAMGPACLVSLAGIGVVLTPLLSRFTRLLAPPLFIVVTVLLVSFPLINIGNFWLTGSAVDADAIHAIFQTHFSEAVQFLGANYSAARLILVFGSIALCLGLIAWKLTTAVASPSLAGLGVLFLTLAVLLADRISDDLFTFSTWRDASIRYYQELQAFHKIAAKRQVMSESYELQRSRGGRVTVLVIGESHNKRHMSLHGYPRDTTPLLVQRSKAENLIVFENAYSNHVHTRPSLSFALTGANQYNGKSWTTTSSLITITRQAGIKTYWISNQQMLGLWDNVVALLARESDKVVSINKKVGGVKKPDKQDEALLPHLRSALREPGEKLIVVHLMGSHSGYCLRFPEAWNTYVGELELSAFGKVSATTKHKRVNCYDNSVRYNDHILDQVFNSLEKSEVPASALYFPDHADEVFNGKFHNLPGFDFSMSDIPLVFAASDSWRKEFSGHWEQLVNNRKKIFTNDLIFETVLGLMGLESDQIDTINDLGHEDFKSIEAPKTLHGRVNIKNKDNYYLWQRTNANLMKKNNLENRLWPHRVNTLGKMLEVTNNGIRSFETDVFFRPESGFFEVGHDAGAMTGMTLESFLDNIPQDFEKIWLDIKNAGKTNLPAIHKRLVELDKKFGLKSRTIIETKDESASPSLLSDSGFHVSYYLPHKEILVVMDQDEKARKHFAKKLAEIAKRQNVGAVSFNLRLYKFVKDDLEPELRPQIVYHTWSPGVSFKNSNLLEEIQAREYFHDPKVETILLPYASPFSL